MRPWQYLATGTFIPKSCSSLDFVLWASMYSTKDSLNITKQFDSQYIFLIISGYFLLKVEINKRVTFP